MSTATGRRGAGTPRTASHRSDLSQGRTQQDTTANIYIAPLTCESRLRSTSEALTDIDAEVAVVGAIVRGPTACDATSTLPLDCFTHPKHRAVVEAARSVDSSFDESRWFERIVVALDIAGQLGAVGQFAGLFELERDAAPGRGGYWHFAEKLTDRKARRDLLDAFAEASRMLLAGADRNEAIAVVANAVKVTRAEDARFAASEAAHPDRRTPCR